MCCSLCKHWTHKKCIGKFSKIKGTFEEMNNFYKNKDWFCFECSRSIFPFLSLCDEDFLISCNNELDKSLLNNNLKNIQNKLSEINLFPETTDDHSDIDKFDPDKNFTFEDNCEYVFNTNTNISNESEISIINFNIRSIRKNFEDFTNLICNSNTNFDVITLTETWMDDNSCLDDYLITGYHPPIAQNRKDRSGGGVLIYLKESFESHNICHKLSYTDIHNNILTVKALKNKKSYCISVCYRAPYSENNTFLENFESVISDVKNKNSIITGDFNYNLFNIQHHEETNHFYNIMTSNSFRTITTKPTRITDNSSTLIDHIWINDMSPSKIESKIVITDITDHLPIFYIKYAETKAQGYTKVNYRPLTDNNIAKFKDKIQNLDAVLSSYTTDSKYGAEDRTASYFEHLGKIYNECFPIKTKKIHNKTLSKPWINQELQRLINKKNRLFGKKLHNKSPVNLQKYKECKKDLAHKLKVSKETYFRNKLMNSSNNMRDKWDAIRIIINKKKKNSTSCPINNRILGNHYSSVARKLNDKLPSSQHSTEAAEDELLNNTNNNFNFKHVSQNEVYEYKRSRTR
jgi:hypothetical protein